MDPSKSRNYRDLSLAIKALLGKQCWAVIGGEGTGTMVTLDCGAKIPRKPILKNSTLSDVERKYEGEIVIFIEMADWRLSIFGMERFSTLNPICDEQGMMEELRGLIGKTITNVSNLESWLRVLIEFDDGFCLEIFLEEADMDDDLYSFHFRDRIYSVKTSGQISCELISTG